MALGKVIPIVARARYDINVAIVDVDHLIALVVHLLGIRIADIPHVHLYVLRRDRRHAVVLRLRTPEARCMVHFVADEAQQVVLIFPERFLAFLIRTLVLVRADVDHSILEEHRIVLLHVLRPYGLDKFYGFWIGDIQVTGVRVSVASQIRARPNKCQGMSGSVKFRHNIHALRLGIQQEVPEVIFLVIEVFAGQIRHIRFQTESGIRAVKRVVRQMQVQVVHLIPGHLLDPHLQVIHRDRLTCHVEHEPTDLVLRIIAYQALRDGCASLLEDLENGTCRPEGRCLRAHADGDGVADLQIIGLFFQLDIARLEVEISCGRILADFHLDRVARDIQIVLCEAVRHVLIRLIQCRIEQDAAVFGDFKVTRVAKPLLQLRQHLRLCILRESRVVLAGDRHRYFIQNGFIRVGCADEFVLNHHVGIHQRLEDIAVRIDNLLIIGTAIGHFNAFRHLRDLQLGILVRQFDGAQKVLRLVNLADEIQILIQPKLAEFYAISAFYSVNHQFDILGRILFVQDELLFRLHLTFAYRIDRLPIRAIVGKLNMEIHTCVRVVPLKLQTVERDCCGKRNLQRSSILNVSARPIGGEVAVQRIVGAALRRGLGCLGKAVLRLIDIGDIRRPNAHLVDGGVSAADTRQASDGVLDIPGCCPFRNHIRDPLAIRIFAAVDARRKCVAVRAGGNRVLISSLLCAIEQRINLGDFHFSAEVNRNRLREASAICCPTRFQIAIRDVRCYVAFVAFFAGYFHRLAKRIVGRVQIEIAGQRFWFRSINLKLINRNRGISAVLGAQHAHIARFLLFLKCDCLGLLVLGDRDRCRVGPLFTVV